MAAIFVMRRSDEISNRFDSGCHLSPDKNEIWLLTMSLRQYALFYEYERIAANILRANQNSHEV